MKNNIAELVENRSRIWGRVAATALSVVVAGLAMCVTPREANALPSFARQTGQPCGACHTDFPQLTPYGRSFKLGGYTQGGGEKSEAYKRTFAGSNWIPPISTMLVTSFTKTKGSLPTNGNDGDITGNFNPNNNLMVQQASVFYGGKIYEDLGAFVQATYDGPSRTISWDNADFRYTKNFSIAGTNVLLGVNANNSPTVQDPWNTVPSWWFPYMSQGLFDAPPASTRIEGSWNGRVGSVGGYAWINNLIYVELSGYSSLPRSTQRSLGVDYQSTCNPAEPLCAGPLADSLKKVSPYWRLAVEPKWGNHSLMVGTFGMISDVAPQGVSTFGTDRFTDLGFDSQYQYIIDKHSLTVKGTYIYEKQQLDASSNPGFTDPFGATAALAANATNTLHTLRASATYTYGNDDRFAVTGAYFSTYGSSDATLYGTDPTTTAPRTPNTDGWTAELAYMPWGMGQPKLWPWYNAKFGIQYTAYNKFNGGSDYTDSLGNVRKASDNNTLFLYAWFAM